MVLPVYRALGSALCTAFLTVESCRVYLEQGEDRDISQWDLRALPRQQTTLPTAGLGFEKLEAGCCNRLNER